MKQKINIAALIIIFAASVNCGAIGVFKFNVMTWLFTDQTATISRIIYVLVAAAGLWCVSLVAVQGRINQIIRYTAPDPIRSRYVAPDPMRSIYTAPTPVRKSDARSLKDNPAGETVCSPHFSQGCINEDTESLKKSKKGV